MPLCVYMYMFVCLMLWYLYKWKKKDATLRELWWTTEVINVILVWTWTWQMWSRSKSMLYLFPSRYLWSITRMTKGRSMKNGHLKVRAKKTMQGWWEKEIYEKEIKVLHRAQNSHMQWGHKENMYYMHEEQCEKKTNSSLLVLDQGLGISTVFNRKHQIIKSYNVPRSLAYLNNRALVL